MANAGRVGSEAAANSQQPVFSGQWDKEGSSSLLVVGCWLLDTEPLPPRHQLATLTSANCRGKGGRGAVHVGERKRGVHPEAYGRRGERGGGRSLRHQRPEDAVGRRTGRLQILDEARDRNAELLRVEDERHQPEACAALGRVHRPADNRRGGAERVGEATKPRNEPLREAAAPRKVPALQPLELAETHRALDLGQPRVVADAVVLLRRASHLPAVVAQRLHRARRLRQAADHHAALAGGGDVLRLAEGEAAGVAKRTDLAAAVFAAEALGAVLDYEDAALPRKREDWRHVGDLPVEVHHHDGPGARGERRRDRARVEHVVGPDVREDRARAGVGDGGRAGAEGIRRHHHVVAASDAQRLEREVERGGAGRDRERALRAKPLRKRRLELAAARAGPVVDAARAQHLQRLALRLRREPRPDHPVLSIAHARIIPYPWHEPRTTSHESRTTNMV